MRARQLIERDIFDPSVLSDKENEFVFENAGTPPHLALEPQNIPMRTTMSDKDPNGQRFPVEIPAINVDSMRAILQRFVELEQRAEARGTPWLGVGPVKERIRLWLDWYRKAYAESKAENEGAGHHPSMSTYTSGGDEVYQGVGSDSGRVRTYFDESGKRVPWALNLRDTTGSVDTRRRRQNFARRPAAAVSDGEQADPPKGEAKPLTDGAQKYAFEYDDDKGILTCPVPGCHHTESWDVKRSSRYRGLAKGRMVTHCKTARDERNEHRRAYYDLRGK